MWIPGHAQVGWFLARAVGLESRDRRIVTLCAVLPDLDGITLLGGLNTYLGGHHVYLHNLFALAIIPLVAATFAKRRITTAAACLAGMLLHLLSDGFGLLELRPLWPLSAFLWWPNQGNFTIAFLSEVVVPVMLILWSAAVLRQHRLSFLETISPRIDPAMVNWLKRFAHRQGVPAVQARGGVIQEVIADLILFIVLVGLSQVVLMTIGAPSWIHATGIGAVATVVVRWLAPAVVLHWLRGYAAGFSDPGE